MVNILDIQILLDLYPKLPFTQKDLIKCLEQNLTLGDQDLNIIFVESVYIKELNGEYRNIDEVTDVLSFNLDSNNLLGEIYICPEYVINNFSDTEFIEEIIRLCVHGILHLQGHRHKKEFDKVDYKKEPMYIKQEEIVNKMLRSLIQK